MNNALSNGRSVVFDLDGVLVLSEHLWEEAWISVAAAHQYEWLPEDTRTCQGKSVPEWAQYLADRAEMMSDDAASAVIGSVAAAYDRGEVPLIDGALDLVQAAADRVPLALASSAPREIIDRVMTTTPLGQFFQATVSSAEVEKGKPHPHVYQEAISRLGSMNNRSFAIEDSSNGIRAAAAAGLTVLGIEQPQYPIDLDAAGRAIGIYNSLDHVSGALMSFLDEGQPL